MDMRKLGRIIYLSLFGTLGTLVALLVPAYFLLALFVVLALSVLAQQLNFYKIMMLLKRFVRDTQGLYFENKLKLRTGFRSYTDDSQENSGTWCR